MEQKKRIESFDLAKGIGILLVVWAHARGPFSGYIYQFHMPFFFVISGLLYSRGGTVRDYILRKIRSLYIPFVFWNLFFYVGKNLYHFSAIHWQDFGKNILYILLTLSKDGQFCGATWFLGSLFLVSIAYRLLDAVIDDSPLNDVLKLGMFAAAAILGFRITLPLMFSRTLVLGLFFALGVLVRKYAPRLRSWDHPVLTLLMAILFLVIGRHGSANMGANEYSSPLLFVLGAAMASHAILWLCRQMETWEHPILRAGKSVLVLLGRRSLDIVIWQFVFFRLGIVLQMYLHGESITVSGVLSYYPIYSSANGWWLIYTILGVVCPLLWCWMLRQGPWGKLLKKLYIV